MIIAALLALPAVSPNVVCSAESKAVDSGLDTAVPAWLYPLSLASAGESCPDPSDRLSLSGSRFAFTRAQLKDLYSTSDRHPESHPSMPEIVARGRAPDVYGCGCHTPRGQGRSENAPLAGLPAAYIELQMADLGSGARRGAWPGPYAPAGLMIQGATHVSLEHVARFEHEISRSNLKVSAHSFGRRPGNNGARGR